MARAATRITLRHDDLAGQRAWLDAVRAEPYTGLPRKLPRVIRPKPEPQPPSLSLFACLPKAKRPPKPATLPIVKARPAEPAPADFTAEETAEIESYVARKPICGPAGDAAMRRWKGWLTDGRAPERSILRPPGVGAAADVEVLENRLGWAALVRYADHKDVDARNRHGHLTMPDTDGFKCLGLFFWRTRDAAIAHCAHKIWMSFWEDDGSTGRRLKRKLTRAENIKLFFQQCGIDVTNPPPRA